MLGKLLLWLVALLVSTLLPQVAFAGYYQVSYSGGSATILVYGFGSYPKPYAGTSTWSGGGGSCTEGPMSFCGPGAVDCTGTITVTFTWFDNPNDPYDVPPQYVLVTDVATATWQGETGNAANGLGHAAVPYGEPGEGEQSTGSRRWKKQDPGLNFSYEITPHADADRPTDSNVSLMEAIAEVSVTSTLVPVDIVFSGVTPQTSGPRILVGQELVSLVSGGAAHQDDTYSWSVSGGNPFADYSEPGPPTFRTDLSLPVTTPTLANFFITPVTATVSCTYYSATLAESFALTKDVDVDRPDIVTYSAIGNTGLDGSALVVRDAQFVSQAGTNYGNLPAIIGTVFEAALSNPAIFGTGGGWHFLQLLVPQRSVATPTATFKPWYIYGNIGVPANGKKGLDTEYPYGFDSGTGGVYSQAPNGTYRTTQDNPKAPQINPEVTKISVMGESLEMFVMFKPSAVGAHRTAGIPLAVFLWTWTGEAQFVNGTWQLQPGGSTSMSSASPLLHPVWGNTGNSWNGIHDISLWRWRSS